MKLTKTKLQQMIKEELGGLREQSGGSVWVVRSEVIDDHGTEDKFGTRRIVGIFTDESEAEELLAKLSKARGQQAGSVTPYELNTRIYPGEGY